MTWQSKINLRQEDGGKTMSDPIGVATRATTDAVSQQARSALRADSKSISCSPEATSLFKAAGFTVIGDGKVSIPKDMLTRFANILHGDAQVSKDDATKVIKTLIDMNPEDLAKLKLPNGVNKESLTRALNPTTSSAQTPTPLAPAATAAAPTSASSGAPPAPTAPESSGFLHNLFAAISFPLRAVVMAGAALVGCAAAAVGASELEGKAFAMAGDVLHFRQPAPPTPPPAAGAAAAQTATQAATPAPVAADGTQATSAPPTPARPTGAGHAGAAHPQHHSAQGVAVPAKPTVTGEGTATKPFKPLDRLRGRALRDALKATLEDNHTGAQDKKINLTTDQAKSIGLTVEKFKGNPVNVSDLKNALETADKAAQKDIQDKVTAQSIDLGKLESAVESAREHGVAMPTIAEDNKLKIRTAINTGLANSDQPRDAVLKHLKMAQALGIDVTIVQNNGLGITAGDGRKASDVLKEILGHGIDELINGGSQADLAARAREFHVAQIPIPAGPTAPSDHAKVLDALKAATTKAVAEALKDVTDLSAANSRQKTAVIAALNLAYNGTDFSHGDVENHIPLSIAIGGTTYTTVKQLMDKLGIKFNAQRNKFELTAPGEQQRTAGEPDSSSSHA